MGVFAKDETTNRPVLPCSRTALQYERHFECRKSTEKTLSVSARWPACRAYARGNARSPSPGQRTSPDTPDKTDDTPTPVDGVVNSDADNAFSRR
jgi:hypothetical protein